MFHVTSPCVLFSHMVYSFLEWSGHATMYKAVCQVISYHPYHHEWMGLVWLLGSLIVDVSVGSITEKLLISGLAVCLLRSAEAQPFTFEFFHLFCFIFLVLKAKSDSEWRTSFKLAPSSNLHRPASSSKMVGMLAANSMFKLFLTYIECSKCIFYLFPLLERSWRFYYLDFGEAFAIIDLPGLSV